MYFKILQLKSTVNRMGLMYNIYIIYTYFEYSASVNQIVKCVIFYFKFETIILIFNSYSFKCIKLSPFVMHFFIFSTVKYPDH